MKGCFYFLIYTFLLLIIGRNLVFLPQIQLKSAEQKTKNIKKEVYEYVLKQKGDYSIYYKDLTSNQEFGIDENKILKGASLNKIFITAYLYHLAQDRKVNLDDKIVIQKDDIQDYGTGSLRYGSEGKSYSIKTLAKLSLEQSDNTAAHILGVRLGMENIEKYVRSLGLSSTLMKDNKTSAKDIGNMLDLIYRKKVTDRYSLELLDFLKDTDFEDRLPRFLDKNTAVYHKTGDAVGMIHDGGIIDNRKNPFILVVMSNDVTKEEEAKEVIGRIAEMVYENQ